jgi:hypothetical protein
LLFALSEKHRGYLGKSIRGEYLDKKKEENRKIGKSYEMRNFKFMPLMKYY